MAVFANADCLERTYHDWRFADLSAQGGLLQDGKRYGGVWYCTKCRTVEVATILTLNGPAARS